MDTSKQVFQLHGVNAAEEPILRKKLRRREMAGFFQRLEPTVVGIDACGGAHHWARVLQGFGHQSLPRRRCLVPEDWRDGARLWQAVGWLRDRLLPAPAQPSR